MKVYEITLRTFLYPIIVGFGIFAIIYGIRNYSTEKITYNDDIGLNQITQNYSSGVYEEIVIQGANIQAKKKATENVVNGKVVTSREVDRTMLPANLEITDIGLSNPANPTKVTIKEEGWGTVLADLLPSLLGTLLFIVFLFFIMGRMGG